MCQLTLMVQHVTGPALLWSFILFTCMNHKLDILCSGAVVVDLLEVGTGPIFLEDLICDGSESSLLECAEKAGPIRAHSCPHSRDVGLFCNGDFIVCHKHM